MHSTISIRNIEKQNNVCRISFECSRELDCYFGPTHEFMCEYSENIQFVPDSIISIPFICNILPLVWLTDSFLELDSIDKDFYESVVKFKAGYKKMYPQMKFQGGIHADQIVDNDSRNKGKRCGAFFSGGVDAFATLIAHIDQKPDLITVWGSDITLEDKEGWQRVWTHTINTGKQFGTNCIAIKTNFRSFIDNKTLNILCKDGKDSWWHGFQHGIGLIGLSAPLAWINGYHTVYIASSFTEADKLRGSLTCASDPEIDGNVRFCGCKVIHDQFEYNRQEKVDHICRFAEKNKMQLDIRVCYAVEGGINCCACEKCIRTMMEIIASGANPENYGFIIDKKLLKRYKRTVVSRVNNITLPFWEDIKRLVNSNPKIRIPKELEWIKTIDIMKEKRSTIFKIDLFMHRAIGKIKRTLKFQS